MNTQTDSLQGDLHDYYINNLMALRGKIKRINGIQELEKISKIVADVQYPRTFLRKKGKERGIKPSNIEFTVLDTRLQSIQENFNTFKNFFMNPKIILFFTSEGKTNISLEEIKNDFQVVHEDTFSLLRKQISRYI